VAEGTARGLVQRYGGPLVLGERIPRSAFRHSPPGDARVLRIRRGSGPDR
jgi:hypothetical protein